MSASVSDIYNYRQATPDVATSGQPREEQLAAIAAAPAAPAFREGRAVGGAAPRRQAIARYWPKSAPCNRRIWPRCGWNWTASG